MVAIVINQFAGEASGITPRLIPQGFAQRARNVDVSLRSLKPLNNVGDVIDDVGVYNPQTVFRYRDQHWLAWGADVDVVRSPLADDPYKRIYWTGDGVPKMAAVDTATSGAPPYPNDFRKLGIPAPTGLISPITPDRPDTIVDSDANEDGEDGASDQDNSDSGEQGADQASDADDQSEPETIPFEAPDTAVEAVYIFTYVSEYGEEGPPSNPSYSVLRWDDSEDDSVYGRITLDMPRTDSIAANITKLRIYRSEGGGSFNYVMDIIPGANLFEDTVPSKSLLAPVPSIEWEPPNAEMRGIISVAGGGLAGFFDNVLCFSEPGYPHAWPTGYRHVFDDQIVGIAVVAAGIVVCTTGAPSLVVGSTAAAMQALDVDSQQACLSKRSIVDMGEHVLYACPNGLVAVSGQGAPVISRDLMTKEQWQALNPASIHAYRDDNRYIAFYTDSQGSDGAFVFTPESGFEFIEGITASAASYQGSEGGLYIVDDGKLRLWEAGEAMLAEWRSGIYEVSTPSKFTCAKLVAADYPVRIKLYGDGAVIADLDVPDNRMFRLPTAYVGIRELEIELQTQYEVFSVQVAQAPQEII